MGAFAHFTIITGASQGLGKALARQFAQQGCPLVLLSLPNENLPELAAQLRQTFEVEVLYYETDLTQIQAVQAFYDWVKSKKLTINTLINNAGIGGTISFERASVAYIENIILLNIRALAMLTRLFIADLQQQDSAYILNISSLAAFSPIPFKTVYPASKAFVYSFSLGLREELRHTSIRVCVLHPGPMATTHEQIQRLQQHGFFAKMSTLSVDTVAQIAIQQMRRGRSVIIPGTLNKLSYRMMKMIPHAVQVSILRKIFTKELTTGHVK